MSLAADATIGQLLNGVNLTSLSTDSLYRHRPEVQILKGRKTFRKGVTFGDVTSDGLIDGLNVTTSAFVTLHSDQVVIGKIKLFGDLKSSRLEVEGKGKSLCADFVNDFYAVVDEIYEQGFSFSQPKTEH